MAKKPFSNRQHSNNSNHVEAREDYLYDHGAEARYRRSVERGGTPRFDSAQPGELFKWEEDLLMNSSADISRVIPLSEQRQDLGEMDW